MPSDKAIEDALDGYYDGDYRKALGLNEEFLSGKREDMRVALAAAYAVDGDFNAGVEAAARSVEARGVRHYTAEEVAAEIRKLKR